MIISSQRPVTFSIRRNGARTEPGSSRVKSLVRYRITGRACFVSDVNTNSPRSPAGITSPVAGSTTSGKK